LPENKAGAPLIRGQRPLGLTKGVNGAEPHSKGQSPLVAPLQSKRPKHGPWYGAKPHARQAPFSAFCPLYAWASCIEHSMCGLCPHMHAWAKPKHEEGKALL